MRPSPPHPLATRSPLQLGVGRGDVRRAALERRVRRLLEQREQPGEPGAAAMQEGSSCSVCLEAVEDPCLTPCGHVFCYECIAERAKVTNKCPLCKVVFTNILRKDGSNNVVEDRVQVATASGMQSYTVQETAEIGTALERSLAGMEALFAERRGH